jgi:hypothetical protein
MLAEKTPGPVTIVSFLNSPIAPCSGFTQLPPAFQLLELIQSNF